MQENGLTIEWKIENISFFRENIRSAPFKHSGEQWCLLLQSHPEYVECRIIPCGANCDRILKARISFLRLDVLPIKVVYNTHLRVSRKALFELLESSFLSEDTLTVHCRLPEDNVDISDYPNIVRDRGGYFKTTKVSIQSRIGFQSKTFEWIISPDYFASQMILVENSDQYGKIELWPIYDKKSWCDIGIGITRKGGEKCYCLLKVYVLGYFNDPVSCTLDEFVFEKEDKEQFWSFPPIPAVNDPSDFAALLISDKLFLKCVFSVTQGKESELSSIYEKKYFEARIKKERLSTSFETDVKNKYATIGHLAM